MSKSHTPSFAPAADEGSGGNLGVRIDNEPRRRRHIVSLLALALLLSCPATLFPQTSRWKVYTRENSLLGDDNVLGIGIDSSGYRWVGTMSAGLYRIDGTEWRRYDRSNSALPSDTVISILIRPDGSRWFGTHGGGLVSYHNDTWEVYDTGNCGLASNDISGNALFLDHNDIMWVGTWGGGICRFWDETWDLIDTGNSPLPDQIVWSGCVDNSGTVWLGTYRGLARYRNGSWDVFTMDNSDIPYNDISSLCSDRDDANAVWLGTWRGGIARFDGTHWTKFDSLNSKLPGNYVEALAYDSQNRLWIGSWGGGVAVYDGNGWVVFDSSNSELPSNNIRMLLDDPQNSRMWICSDGGLASYDYRSLSAAPGPTTAARNLRVVQISPNDLPTIDIALPRSSRTTVALFDIDGRRVATLAEGRMGRGTHTIPIPATTPNGFYNCVMSLDGKQVASTKVLLHR